MTGQKAVRPVGAPIVTFYPSLDQIRLGIVQQDFSIVEIATILPNNGYHNSLNCPNRIMCMQNANIQLTLAISFAARKSEALVEIPRVFKEPR
jgi:hypothetical protein